MTTLLDVRNYLRRHQKATLSHLSQQFLGTQQMLIVMLDELEKRGKITKSDTLTDHCRQKMCQGCNEAKTEVVYRWYAPELAIQLVG